MANRKERRAEWERNFKATHGVSSGTYYTMRRQASSAGSPAGREGYQGLGISPKTFDMVARKAGYNAAKQITQQARTDLDGARYNALVLLEAIPPGMALSDYDSSFDYDWIPDDFDWWYH